MNNRKRAEIFEEYILKIFDIKKYDSAKDLDVRGWCLNIGTRKIFRRLCTFSSSHAVAPELISDNWKNQSEFMIRILLTPVITDNSVFNKNEKIYNPTVMPLSVAEAWEFHHRINTNEKYGAACQEWWDEINSDIHSAFDCEGRTEDEMIKFMVQFRDEMDIEGVKFDVINVSFDEAIAAGSNMMAHAHLQVDLSAPDDLIFADFKKWLNAIRKKEIFYNSPVKKFTDNDFAKWCQSRVLAYIDLTESAKLFGVKLPFHRLGSILFPEYEDIDVSEKVRKTIVPLATEIMNSAFFDALNAEANNKRRQLAEENRA